MRILLALVGLGLIFLACLLLASCEAPAPSGSDFPGPSSIVVTINPNNGERICLARTVDLFDDQGGVYTAEAGDCSSFAVILGDGATLSTVEVSAKVSFTLSVDY